MTREDPGIIAMWEHLKNDQQIGGSISFIEREKDGKCPSHAVIFTELQDGNPRMVTIRNTWGRGRSVTPETKILKLGSESTVLTRTFYIGEHRLDTTNCLNETYKTIHHWDISSQFFIRKNLSSIFVKIPELRIPALRPNELRRLGIGDDSDSDSEDELYKSIVESMTEATGTDLLDIIPEDPNFLDTDDPAFWENLGVDPSILEDLPGWDPESFKPGGGKRTKRTKRKFSAQIGKK